MLGARLDPIAGSDRHAASIARGSTAYQVIVEAITAAPPNGGKLIKTTAKFIFCRRVPPGCGAAISFEGSKETLPLFGGLSIPFVRTDGPNQFKLHWTADEAAQAPREAIELWLADDFMALPGVERCEFIPAPATSGYHGQRKPAAPGTAEPLSDDFLACEEVMVTAPAENVAPVTIGFSDAVAADADGSGDGDVLSPGSIKTYPVDSPSRLYVNTADAADYVSWICVKSRR